MGDSDDEYDRKRRDKFRGERSAGDTYRTERREERGVRGGREEWPERARARPDYREYRPRERYSPGRDGPPVKRMRGDWGDEGRLRYGHDAGPYAPYGWGHEPYPMHGGHGYPHHGPMPARAEPIVPVNPDVQTQPAMMTLKQFLATQDDSISDSDAITKYNDYKLEFKRQQLNEFFVAHKDEEWFKNKYHPEESLKRRNEQITFLKKRAEVFDKLLQAGSIEKVSVDTNQSDQLLKLLDTVVIKLEGGTDDDLAVLDEKPLVAETRIINPKPIDKNDEDVVIITDTITNPESSNQEENKTVEESNTTEEENAVSRKRKRSNSNSSSSSSDSENEKEKEDEEKTNDNDNENDIENEASKNAEDVEMQPDEKEADTEDKSETHEIGEDNPEEKTEENKQCDSKEEGAIEDESNEAIDVDEKDDVKIIATSEAPKPKELHRTSSIFLRNLAPTITKAEVEAMCKRYDGFLRVAIADPLAERRWFRRGWVTFKRDVNIKEICWNLNNYRLKDCELGAIVNRDLSRRVRPVNGITVHKQVLTSDIKLCAKIAHNLDTKAGLWRIDIETTETDENGVTKKRSDESFSLDSKNPILQNITDYLIEEGSAEEDELLGLSNHESKEQQEGEILERDPQLISVLDKIILYLRIVHSVDFYNHCEYQYEDEMPNRCGIIHARGPAPQAKVTNTEVQDYIRTFENKMTTFLTRNQQLEAEELKKLGSKDPDTEVEKFVQANMQELAKDKWLCPLSGKKFKGPEFIRKHIFNKHSEKVEEVRKEVEYFNNYLKDAKRPQLAEHPGNNRKGPGESPMQPGFRPPGFMGPVPYPQPYPAYAPPMAMGGGPRGMGRGGFGGGRRNQPNEFRPIIHYRDLDAPREPEEFL